MILINQNPGFNTLSAHFAINYPAYAAKRRKRSVFIRPTCIISRLDGTGCVPVFCRFVIDVLLI